MRIKSHFKTMYYEKYKLVASFLISFVIFDHINIKNKGIEKK